MANRRFNEEQIFKILKEADAGTPVKACSIPVLGGMANSPEKHSVLHFASTGAG